MSICPTCKVDYALFREMTAVVVAAERLVDKAGGYPFNRSEIAAAGATLAKMVKTYRTTAKRFEPKGDENAVQ
jgi:hypothetical protein